MIFEYNKNIFNSIKSKNFFTKSALNDIYLKNIKSLLTSHIDNNIRENVLSTIVKKNIISEINLLNNITESSSYYYHCGYLEYILCAISNNYGFEISPWNIWSIIIKQIYNLCITTIIIDKYDKIIINEENPIYNITIDTLIMNEFENDKIKDIFIPQFISSSFQKNNYKLFINSILLSNTNTFKTTEINENYKRKNKIKIVGGQLDWNILYNSTKKILVYVLENENLFTKTVNHIEYINKLLEYVENIKNNWNKSYFWENFIMIKYVKGINQKMIYGDITNLFYESIFLDRLPVITSNIVFYNEYYKKEININCGVLTSILDNNNILVCQTNIDIQPLQINMINSFIFDIDKWIFFEKQLRFLNLFNPDNIYNHINNNSFLVDNSVMIPLLDNKNLHENNMRKELLKINYNFWFQHKNNIPFKNNLFIFLTYNSYEIKYPELNEQVINLFYNNSGINNFIIKFLYLQNNNYFKYDLMFFIMNTLHKQLITDITLAFANINYYYKSLMLHHIYNFIFNNIGFEQIIYLDSQIEKELREYFMDIFNEELTSIINEID